MPPARCLHLLALAAGITLLAPLAGDGVAAVPSGSAQEPLGNADRVAVITGLAGPEAVRHDPDQDVWFVANWAGDATERDGNGFVSRVGADGRVRELRFLRGSERAPLHAPRGMTIVGDVVWVVDIDGVHGFDRYRGEHLAFVDMSAFEPGFLNDVAADSDGNLWVTDTGGGRVFRVVGREVTVEHEALADRPNGITFDPLRGRMILAPWGGGQSFVQFDPAGGAPTAYAASAGGNFDGIELYAGGLLAASQADTSIRWLREGESRILIVTEGRPADIGLDVERRRIAVPYIALDRVDIWQLPGAQRP